MKYISSQRERLDCVVAEKIKNRDFIVSYVVISDDLRMIVDGHHSHQAAKECGIDPEYVESATSLSYKQELEAMGLDLFLEFHFIDSSWYDINTGIEVF